MFTRYQTFGAAGALALCLPFAPAAVAAPAHVWSQNYGTSGTSSRGFGLATDASGNVILTGSFNGTVSFGGTALVAQGTDVVLAKYNSGGAHLWSKRFGGTSADQGYGVAVDATGNILITGYFQGTAAYFGGVNNLSSSGNNDIFVAKYDANGNHVFSNSTGTPDLDIGYSVAADNSGNAYLTGYLHGIVPSDAVVLKYSSTGSFMWGKIIGNAEGYDEGLAITTDASGNPIVTGSFSGSVDFGGGPLTTSSIDDWDVFVVKYNPAGAHLWSRRYGSTYLDEGLAIKADAGGNVVVSGYFQGEVDFGGGPLTSNGEEVDIFLARYNSSGEHLWSRRLGGTSYESAYALTVDASSRVLLAGYFAGVANFGGSGLQSAGNVDIFYAEYDANGQYLSSQRFGGPAADMAEAIAVDGSGNRYLTGYFAGAADFGGGTVTSSGTPDVFLAKYGEVVSAVEPPALDALAISAAPNPFNPATTIQYRIPTAGRVHMAVYDIRGALVTTLVDKNQPAGAHVSRWDGRDRRGGVIASGVYFAHIIHDGATRTHKLVLLK